MVYNYYDSLVRRVYFSTHVVEQSSCILFLVPQQILYVSISVSFSVKCLHINKPFWKSHWVTLSYASLSPRDNRGEWGPS